MALAHAVGDKVEAAYRQGDLFQKRSSLMNVWAEFCASTPTSAHDNVSALPLVPPPRTYQATN